MKNKTLYIAIDNGGNEVCKYFTKSRFYTNILDLLVDISDKNICIKENSIYLLKDNCYYTLRVKDV